MTLRGDDVVHYVSGPNSVFTLDSVREFIEGVTTVSGGRRALVLADIRELRSADREARKYGSGPEWAAAVEAVANIVDSGISRVLGNFFIGINKPSVPTKLFTSEDEGLAWLKSLERRNR